MDVAPIRPVGVMHVAFSDEEVRRSWHSEDLEGVLEVFPEFEDALLGLEGFSHLLILVWLHKVEGRVALQVRPRRLSRALGVPEDSLPLFGTFCSDSPHRPNPLGIDLVKLVRREGRFLHVRGIDLFDRTPVLDIRSVTPEMIPRGIAVPEWYSGLQRLVSARPGGTRTEHQ